MVDSVLQNCHVLSSFERLSLISALALFVSQFCRNRRSILGRQCSVFRLLGLLADIMTCRAGTPGLTKDTANHRHK